MVQERYYCHNMKNFLHPVQSTIYDQKIFLDNKFLRNSNVQNNRDTNFILYFGHKSVKMKGELSKLIIKYFPSILIMNN